MGVAPEVETAFREVVKQHVDSPLRSHGFRRVGKSWLMKRDSEVIPMVSLQELSRREEAVEFVLDWGVFSSDFCRVAFATADLKPSILRCPFVARLVPAPEFGDQWWEVGQERAWLVNANGTRGTTDFSEVHAGIRDFALVGADVLTVSDVLQLMRSLVDRGDARENFTPTGKALDVLERVCGVR